MRANPISEGIMCGVTLRPCGRPRERPRGSPGIGPRVGSRGRRNRSPKDKRSLIKTEGEVERESEGAGESEAMIETRGAAAVRL